MFAVILENATYKELYLLRYYLSESTPQWFKQGRSRYNTNYYRREKPNAPYQYTSDFVSEYDITRYNGKPVTTVKQTPPYSKYQFENKAPHTNKENYKTGYFSNKDKVSDKPRYSGPTQSVPTTTSSGSSVTPTAVSISEEPNSPINGNSKAFEQFQRPVAVEATPTAMTIATNTATTQASTVGNPTTIVSTRNSVFFTKTEFYESETSVNDSTIGGSEGHTEFKTATVPQVDFNKSQNELESSGDIIFDQFDLDHSQIHLSSINVTNDSETVLDEGLDSEETGEGSGNDDTVDFQVEETDSTTSQMIPTTIFLTTTDGSFTKSSAAILPSQRVNEAPYSLDKTTNSELSDENSNLKDSDNQAETDAVTVKTASEEPQQNTNADLNQPSENNTDITVETTETAITDDTNEVFDEDKEQLSSDILDFDSTVISCQDQRNSDSSKKEYFRPKLQCDNGGVIQIEYAYYGRFNSDTCASGKTESNQAWYWPTCGRKFKVKNLY